jgi:hypothetical protein
MQDLLTSCEQLDSNTRTVIKKILLEFSSLNNRFDKLSENVSDISDIVLDGGNNSQKKDILTFKHELRNLRQDFEYSINILNDDLFKEINSLKTDMKKLKEDTSFKTNRVTQDLNHNLKLLQNTCSPKQITSPGLTHNRSKSNIKFNTILDKK